MKTINSYLEKQHAIRRLNKTADGFITDGTIAIRQEYVNLKNQTMKEIESISTTVESMLSRQTGYTEAQTTRFIYEGKEEKKIVQLRILKCSNCSIDRFYIAVRRDLNDALIANEFCEWALSSTDPVIYMKGSWADAVLMPWRLNKADNVYSLDTLQEIEK